MLERICPFLTTYSPLCDILEGIGPFYEEKWNIFQTYHATSTYPLEYQPTKHTAV